jgi:predicted permease
VSALLQDLKYAIRRLGNQPGFTAIAVLTLGLGIGANTAIFSVMNAVLLRSLPVQEPERLVLWSDSPDEGAIAGSLMSGRWEYFTYPVYRAYRDQLKSVSGLVGIRSTSNALSIIGESGTTDGPAQMGSGQLVSGNYFSVLGAAPLLGRALTPSDDDPAAPPAAVISFGYWSTRLGSDPTAVGRTVQLNGTPVTIVGVMGKDFFGERVRRAPDYWLPLQLQPRIELADPIFDDVTFYGLRILGRLAPGKTLEDAQAEATTILRRTLTDQSGSSIAPETSSQISQSFVTLVPGGRGVSSLRDNYKDSLFVLSAVVALVLLIACANVANLLLARAASRHTEITVRLALGASGPRLARQLLTEGIVLALAGGGLGLVIAAWGSQLLVVAVAPRSPITLELSPGVLGFTMIISLAAGILFSLAPAVRSGRLDLASALKDRSRSGGGPRGRVGLAPALVSGQVSLCLVLLVGAGLLTRSLLNLQSQNIGFDRSGVLLVRLQTRLAGYHSAELPDLYRRLMDQVQAVPGVSSATVANYSPMSDMIRSSTLVIQGYQPAEGEPVRSTLNLVGPRYPETMGMTMLAGRPLNDGDRVGGPKVAMVNEAFAKAYFQHQSPVGHRFGFGDSDSDAGEYEIVGVVGDARFEGPSDEPGKMVFVPILQAADQSAFTSELAIRVGGNPAEVGPAVREAINTVDPRLPISQMISIDKQIESALGQQRLFARLVGVFGALAVLLACVGLYGVVAQSVARRANEVGIRMALGAQPNSIIGMVLKETLTLIAVGLAIGVPAAVAGAQMLRKQLFGVGTADPLTLVGTSLILVTVAAIAGLIPARRAARVAPMSALRRD